MKEEMLKQMKEDLMLKKEENNCYNERVKMIKNLEKDSKVKEYLRLTGIDNTDLKQERLSDKKIILSFYRNYLNKIKENDTNGIYVYMGTYQNSSEIDIIHGSSDIRVDYSSPLADYREYRDIEFPFSVMVPIKKCEQFEKEHIVINPKMYLASNTYYNIQEEFFIRAVKTNQDSALKLILKKYDRLGK